MSKTHIEKSFSVLTYIYLFWLIFDFPNSDFRIELARKNPHMKILRNSLKLEHNGVVKLITPLIWGSGLTKTVACVAGALRGGGGGLMKEKKREVGGPPLPFFFPPFLFSRFPPSLPPPLCACYAGCSNCKLTICHNFIGQLIAETETMKSQEKFNYS